MSQIVIKVNYVYFKSPTTAIRWVGGDLYTQMKKLKLGDTQFQAHLRKLFSNYFVFGNNKNPSFGGWGFGLHSHFKNAASCRGFAGRWHCPTDPPRAGQIQGGNLRATSPLSWNSHFYDCAWAEYSQTNANHCSQSNGCVLEVSA